jgi:NAD(P)-dependent dehydrogenase (short-subunit alcohol dehydrogenase family)
VSGFSGKVCVVTGANRGLGKATSLGLAKLGATVILICREKVRGEETQAEIREISGNDSVELLLCDLSNLNSVKKLAKDFAFMHKELNVLVNAAAIYTPRRTLTLDGLELMFATNYLGPFLLTNLLLDFLKAGSPSRIITLSAPSTTKLDFENLQGEKHFGALTAFGASKTADLLFTYELARRLDGSGVTANILFPGVMKTDLMREAPWFAKLITNLIGKSPEKGAEAAIYLASSPNVEGLTGRFFKGKELSDSNAYSHDQAIQQRLWAVSAELTGLSPTTQDPKTKESGR